jgi:hypothetical protein
MYIERAKQMGLQTIMLSQVTPLLVMVESCYLLPVFFLVIVPRGETSWMCNIKAGKKSSTRSFLI